MRDVKIAFRNLTRQKKRTILLAAAIAFGIYIITMINGFTGSFIENVSENFSNLLAGHIFIEGVEKSESGRTLSLVRNDDILMDAIEDNEVPWKYITKRSDMNATLIFEGETAQQTVTGADWDQEEYFKERIILTQGTFEDLQAERQGIIISEKVAEKINVEIGDRLLVKCRTYTGQQNVGEFVMTGMLVDSSLFGGSTAYANISYVNELLNLKPGEYMSMGIYLEDPDMIDETAENLYEDLKTRVSMFERNTGDDDENPIIAMLEQEDEEEWEGLRFRFMTLNDIMKEVQQIVDVLNTAALIILLVLFGIIMVGVTNTFRMVLMERTKEIGTMRAVGMQRGIVRKLFLYEAFFIAVIGVAVGLILAGITMLILMQINWGLDTPAFMLMKNGYMTFKMPVWQIFLNFGIVSILTLFAAFFPSNKAAKLQPADALRSTK
ncbi:MAG: FtsX-like permease family protein [Spirochaetales bacterium]|uniref:FtsX-like permease family protein n=1 Tax=Candidatus Thalassospirochaeta sargassi TaxID=3119039 RepID=A0AAJ1IGA9_9SPIO|nr:FtsX-like permease family protein [Spirochaetales bacterium]